MEFTDPHVAEQLLAELEEKEQQLALAAEFGTTLLARTEELQTERDDLEREREAAVAEAEEYEYRARELQDNLDRLAEEAAVNDAALAEATAEVELREAEVELRESKVEKKHEAIEAELVAAQEEGAAEVAAAKAEVAQELLSNKGRIEALEEANRELETKNQQEIKKATGAIADKLKEEEKLKASERKLSASDRKIRDCERERSGIQQRLDNLQMEKRDKNFELERQLSSGESKFSRIKEENKALEEMLRKKNEELENSEDCLNKTKAVLKSENPEVYGPKARTYSFTPLEPRGDITNSAIERNLRNIAEDVKNKTYITERNKVLG